MADLVPRAPLFAPPISVPLPIRAPFPKDPTSEDLPTPPGALGAPGRRFGTATLHRCRDRVPSLLALRTSKREMVSPTLPGARGAPRKDPELDGVPWNKGGENMVKIQGLATNGTNWAIGEETWMAGTSGIREGAKVANSLARGTSRTRMAAQTCPGVHGAPREELEMGAMPWVGEEQ